MINIGEIEKINMLLFVATILDPQYKLGIVEFWIRNILGIEKVDEFITTLKNDIEALYRHYNYTGQSLSSGGK